MNAVLEDKQLHTLEWLCRIRHEMHTSRECFFAEGSDEFPVFWNYIEKEINTRLDNVHLPCIESLKLYSREDYPTSSYFEDGNSLEGIIEDECDALYLLIEVAECFNQNIETYLENIDSIYNTKFCPSGIRRVRFGQQAKKKYSMYEWQKRFAKGIEV